MKRFQPSGWPSIYAGKVEYELFAVGITAILLLNYVSWLILPGSDLPSILIAVAVIAVISCLGRDVSQRRYLIPVAVAVGFLLLFFAPLTDGDARTIWFFHAKRMYFDGSIDARLDDYPGWAHTSYPDLVPAAAASIARLFGVWNEFLPKTALELTLVPPFLILISRCQSARFRLLMLASLLYLTRTGLFSGSMDAHLALYAVSAIVLLRECLGRQDKSGRSVAATAALVMLVALAGIKNEGTVMAALLLLPMAILLLRKPHHKARLAWQIAFGLLLSSPILIWKLKLISAKITALFIGDPWARFASRLGDEGWMLIAQSLTAETGFALVMLAVLFTLTGKLERLILYFIVGYLGILFFVYLSTPYDLAWHISASVDRVTLVVKLLVAVILILESQRIVRVCQATTRAKSDPPQNGGDHQHIPLKG